MKQKMRMGVRDLHGIGHSSGYFSSAQPSKTEKYKLSEVILTWNMAAYNAMGIGYLHPLLASRINAMVHLAMHDAINATKPNMKPTCQ